ncbi:MAG: hypothetical protein NVS1B4_01320 [Gemmatimonadaceae bacterium]
MKRRPLSSNLALIVGAGCLALNVAGVAEGQQYDPKLLADLKWRDIGPFRGGRTVAVSGVPGQQNVFYMAASNGGVWKTTDYGRVWTPIFDGQSTGSIGALAVAPSDPRVLYVGSGEGLQRPDLSVGNGVYKSTDAGHTWTHLGLRDGRQIGALLVDPRDAQRVYVAVLGHPYGPNAERGVFRSVDGGTSWQKILYKDEDTGAIALALDPTNARIVYASLWSARQGPWEYDNAYGGVGSGLYVSQDGGDRWRQLTAGLPTTAQGLGRIGIGIAPSDRRRIYAQVDADRQHAGLYRSDDAGESWRRVNSESRIGGRGSDFAEVKVDPRNPDVVYVANTSTYRSTDGGRTFTAIKGAPGGDDYHTIWINPADPQIILLGSDQGATISVNGGATWSSWYNQPTAQMFHVTTDDRFPYRVYGGQQESGSAGVASRGDNGAITVRDWHPVGTEEYGYSAPDPLHPGVIYGGKVTRFDETTGDVQHVGPVPVRGSKGGSRFRFDRTAPLLFSPTDPHTLYFASQVLWKTTDGGRQWREISPDLTRPQPGAPTALGAFVVHDTVNHRGVIYAIGPSPRDGRLIWVGTDDGLVHVTHDGGAHWKEVTPPELTPWSKITQIAASRYDAATAYISVSRFRLDDLHPYLYRTRDSGRTWQKITGGLPDDAAVNVVREDPTVRGLLYAGAESGVYVSFDDGERWQSLQLNLPVTSIRDLVIHDADLVIGTHGRGIWILDDITPLRQLADSVERATGYLFRPHPAWRIRRNQNTDTPLPPEEPVGRNPPDGAVIDYYLGTASPLPVVLEIRDRNKELVRRVTSADTGGVTPADSLAVPFYWVRIPRTLSAAKGMHRFVWDLHYAPPPAVHYDYPISAIYRDTPREPLGPAVLPGAYTVVLIVADPQSGEKQRWTQPLLVRLDPRVRTPPQGLISQFVLARRIAGSIDRGYLALRQIRALRGQLAVIRARAGQGAAGDSITALDARAAGVEERSTTAPEMESLTRLNRELVTLLDIVNGTDSAPTPQAEREATALASAVQEQVETWELLRGRDVPALNVRLRAAQLPVVDMSR